MTILGVDPGIATTGVAVVREAEGRRELLHLGVLTTSAGQPRAVRLASLHHDLAELLARWKPGTAAVEQLFFGSNTTTAMAVGEARGVILLAIEQAGVELAEYKPMEVKLSLTGYGRATKPQVMKMVRAIVGGSALRDGLPDDAYDAVAVALCHAQSRRLKAPG